MKPKVKYNEFAVDTIVSGGSLSGYHKTSEMIPKLLSLS